MPYDINGVEIGAQQINAMLGPRGGPVVIGRQGEPNRALVRTVPPNKARYLVMGFGITPVGVGATLNITTQPQKTFRPEKLVVPNDIAGAFSINDIRVGTTSQFVTNLGAPARGFVEDATEVLLGLDTAQIAQDVTINVTNNSGAIVNFEAMLLGPAVF